MGFKFNIADIVTHKAALGERDGKPPKLFILSRVSEECGGGIQKFYYARLIKQDTILSRSVSLENNLVRLHEEELAPYPETPLNK